MNIRKLIFATVAGSGLVISAGCQNEAPITGRTDRFDPGWLTLDSTQLRADTLVQDAKQSRDESGILHVAVPVRNVTDQQLYIEYILTFKDGTGMQVNRYPGRLTIPARQTRDAVGNASGPSAREFHLELNYPRTN